MAAISIDQDGLARKPYINIMRFETSEGSLREALRATTKGS